MCCGKYAVNCGDVKKKYRQDTEELPGPIGRCFAVKNMCDTVIVILTNLAVTMLFMNTWMGGSFALVTGQIAPMDAVGYCRCRDLGKSLTTAKSQSTFESDPLNSQGVGTANQAPDAGASTEKYYYDNFTYAHLCVGEKQTFEYQDNLFVTFDLDDSLLANPSAYYDMTNWMGDGKLRATTGCEDRGSPLKNCSLAWRNETSKWLTETTRRKKNCANSTQCQPGTFCSFGFCRYGCQSDKDCVFNSDASSKCLLAKMDSKQTEEGHRRHNSQDTSQGATTAGTKCRFAPRVCSPFVPVINDGNRNKVITNSSDRGTTLGSACQNSNDCELFQRCSGNKCVYGCVLDTDCPDSHSCDTSKGECSPYEACNSENGVGLTLEKLQRGDEQANPGNFRVPFMFQSPVKYDTWKIEKDEHLTLNLNHTACFASIGSNHYMEMMSTFSVLIVVLIGFLIVVMDIIANLVPNDHKLGGFNVKLYIERDLLPLMGKGCCCCCCSRGQGTNELIVNALYYAFVTLPFNFIVSTFTKVGADVLGNGKYHLDAESSYDGPALWLSSVPNFELFLMLLLGVGVAICTVVLSVMCTKYLCCYGMYECCYVRFRKKDIQNANRKWYATRCVRPCTKTCAKVAMTSWTLLVIAVIGWSVMLNFVVPNFDMSTLVIGLNPLVMTFPSIALPLVACNFTCSVFRINMLVSRSIKALCPGFKTQHFRIKPSQVDEETTVQDITGDDIEDEVMARGSEMLKSEAQKYVVRKVDEKLGEEMGYETKTAEEEGKDDPFL